MEGKEKSTFYKQKGGITLVVLVVTIVVLLILAGVTIAAVLGNNGIIKKANEAKEETRYGRVNEQVQLWKIDWETYNLVGSENKPLEEDEFLEKLLTNQLVNENEIDRENKIITIANKEINYTLKVQSPEEIVIADLPTSIVTADTTSSKLRVQVQKPEGIGENVEYTYTIKKANSDDPESVVQTQTVKDTSYLFESLEAATDYIIEVSTSNVNGTIYKGSCAGNTYNKLEIDLPSGIYRSTSIVGIAISGWFEFRRWSSVCTLRL